MPYNIRYNLSTEYDDSEMSEKGLCRLCEELSKMAVFGTVKPRDVTVYGCSAETTWYEHEKDMLLLSAKFPGVLFTLNGEGDGWSDLWTKYFKDGRIMRNGREIIIHSFNESKLEGIPVVDSGQKYSWEA